MYFSLLLKNMDKTTGKNINKSLNSKYTQKLLDLAKKSATDANKTSSKKVIQKTAGTTSDLIGNRFANKIKKLPKNSQQNNLVVVTNQNNKEIPKKYIYMS